MNEKKHTGYYYINLLFLFLCFIQFFGFTNKWMVLGSALSLMSYIVIKKDYKIGIREILLLTSIILYAFIDKKNTWTLISIGILPVLFFLNGKNLSRVAFEMDEHEEKVLWTLGVLIIGYYIHGFLNTLEYFKLGQLIGVRQWNDFWTGIKLPATAHELFFLPIIAMAFPLFVYLRKYRLICVGGICALCYAIFFSTVSSSRGPLAIFGIIFLLELLLYTVLNRKKLKKSKILKMGVIIGGILVLIALSYFVVCREEFQNSYVLSVLNRGGGILENIRFKAQWNVIKNMFLYPMGGRKIDLLGLSYPHNVWLDLIFVSGIIPFFLFLGYTIFTVFDLARMLKSEGVNAKIKYLIAGLYFCFVLYYMIEPALEGNVQNILPWVYLNGIIYALNEEEKIC